MSRTVRWEWVENGIDAFARGGQLVKLAVGNMDFSTFVESYTRAATKWMDENDARVLEEIGRPITTTYQAVVSRNSREIFVEFIGHSEEIDDASIYLPIGYRGPRRNLLPSYDITFADIDRMYRRGSVAHIEATRLLEQHRRYTGDFSENQWADRSLYGVGPLSSFDRRSGAELRRRLDQIQELRLREEGNFSGNLDLSRWFETNRTSIRPTRWILDLERQLRDSGQFAR